MQFEMGLIYDAMSREEEAIPYYERALSIGLPDEKRCATLLCLGTSYRNVGDLKRSKEVLESGIKEYPDHIGLRCFYALAQYTAGDTGLAVRTLMDAILRIEPEGVKPFANGLRHYRNELK